MPPTPPAAPSRQRPTTRQPRRGRADGAPSTRRRRRPAPSDRTGVNTILGWGAAILVAAVLSFGFKMWSKSGDNAHIKQEMIDVVATFPNYEEKRAYYHRLIDRHHAAAFEASYALGGRRRGNSFDAQRYVTSISRAMGETAGSEGEPEVSGYLVLFHGMVSATTE